VEVVLEEKREPVGVQLIVTVDDENVSLSSHKPLTSDIERLIPSGMEG
jgi:hypothetical protein